MLAEVHVRNLGVIDDLKLTLREGMTALTGETGAGKTLLVTAIELLVGERADPTLIRPGAQETLVEGRFLLGRGPDEPEDETVVARSLPLGGRSRAYVDGRLATASELASLGRGLVDLHGQHSHQSLLSGRVQRDALDLFGRVDLGPLRAAEARLASIEVALATLGGDSRSRAREVDLLRYQLGELDAAGIDDPDEEVALESEEDALADAGAHRAAASAAYAWLAGDGAAADGIRRADAELAGRRPFAELAARLAGLAAEVDDVAAEIRLTAEGIAEDPERLEEVRARRRLLRELRRKYGERLSEVLAFQETARARLGELESYEARASELEREAHEARAERDRAGAAVGAVRRAAAPALAAAVEANLGELALAGARFEVEVDGDEGEKVRFLLAPNRGERPLPLARAASGGELARTMLALRLVLSDAPSTLVFDEVDAGVGGQAALAVGRSLAALGARHQVLVVTHLPQVAAFADHQVVVRKGESGGRTVATAEEVSGTGRVVELSRMLSGQPASTTARDHAEELLAVAARERGR